VRGRDEVCWSGEREGKRRNQKMEMERVVERLKVSLPNKTFWWEARCFIFYCVG
jgi:hypothetical protein